MLEITKNKEGERSLGRTITVLTALTLTFGFYKEALTNGLMWQDYIAYSVAMVATYSTAKAIDLIRAIKGSDKTDDKTT
jgi:hypothetical protein